MAVRFPTDMSLRGAVKGTDKLLIGNIDTGATEYTTVAELLKDQIIDGATLTGSTTLPSTTTIGSVTSTELGYIHGLSSAIQTQLNALSPLANPIFTGTVRLPATTIIGYVDASEIAYLQGCTSNIQNQLNLLSPKDNPIFTTKISTPTLKISNYPTIGYVWKCVNDDGSGAWSSFASDQNYIGVWDADTNTPGISDGIGNKGDYYTCNVAGTVDFGSGNITFAVGDQAIYNGAIWEKIPVSIAVNLTGPITSVGNATAINSQTGTGSTFAMSESPEFTTQIKIENITISSESGSDNYVVNAAHNIIEVGTDICVISGGGNTGNPNLIGNLGGIPNGKDKLYDAEWITDDSYVANSAGVATICGGYDHVNNQLAGTIIGGGHNFIRYNSNGHSIIGGGSYNLISAGRSGIFCGRDNSITGDFIYSVISGGYNNRIIGSYSSIPGGANNKITGNYSFVFGRHAIVTADGSLLFVDGSSGSDYEITTANLFAARYANGYGFMEGNFGIHTLSPEYDLTLGNDENKIIGMATEATDTNASSLTIHPSNCVEGTSADDKNGGSMIICAGVGTGAGTSSISFNTGTTRASGKTLQTLSTKMKLNGIGQLSLGTVSPKKDAIFQIDSVTKAFLPPRMSTAQRDAITSPVEGMIIYNTTTHILNHYNGTNWVDV